MTYRLAAIAIVFVALVAPGTSEGAESVGSATVFAHVGAPGHPDTSVVAPDGSVIVSTNRGARGSTGPSILHRFSARGKLIRTYSIQGQNLGGDHGTMGLAFDQQGRLYVADYSPPRILRLDLATGRQQTYATVPDLPLCPASGVSCDNGIGDSKPWPDGLAFDSSGRLLVTDLAQGTVFIVKNGGGPATPWLQAPLLRSVYGPNQLAFDRDGSLVLDVTASIDPVTLGRGVIYRIPVSRAGTPGALRQVYATRPGEGPDGFALGRSGRIYLCTLVTDRVIVVERDGSESTSFGSALGNPAFDSPSSATFLGTALLITNLTYFTNNTAHDNVLRVNVGDTGVPALRPRVT